MRTAFIIERINHYRTFATLITEGLIRDHDIECWHLCSEGGKESEKGYLYPEPDKIPLSIAANSNLSIKSFRSKEEMASEISSRSEVDCIISLSPPEFIDHTDRLNSFKGVWCIIMHGPDSFKEIARFDKIPINKNIKRIFFPYTQHFFDWGMDFSNRFLPLATRYFNQPSVDVVPSGCPMYDESILKIDPLKARKKFGIPDGQKTVVYLPYSYLPSKENKSTRAWQAAFSNIHIHRRVSRRFNDDSFERYSPLKIAAGYLDGLVKILPDATAREHLIKGWHEPGIIKALRAFCDRNNLLLVIKPRKKFDFSEEIYRQAHIIIDDDESQQYPSKLQELLSTAALGVGFFSTAVIEAIYQSVPFINVECLDQRFMDIDKRPWHPNHSGSIYNFDDVVWNFSTKDLVEKLPELPLSHFALDPIQQEHYSRKFLGPNKQAAKINIFDTLESSLT